MKQITGFITWVRTFLDDIYQSKLVSGINIRTVNGNDLLGSGNITIGGGSSNIKFYAISSSNYNPNIDNTVTITITVTDGDGNLVLNHQFTLNANGTNVSLTTNSNGIATYTYTCSSWGLHTFSVRDNSIQIKVGGYKTQTLTGVKLYYNDHEVNAVINHTQNLTGSSNPVTWTNSSASAIPSGLRPRIHQFAPSLSSDVRIRVNLNGNIQYQTTSSTSNYHLQGNFCWFI